MDLDTKLTILKCGLDEEEVTDTYTGRFRDMDKGLSFFIESPDLDSHSDKFNEETKFRVEFLRGSTLFAFSALFNGKFIKDDKPLISLTQISDIKESTQRAMPRIELSAGVIVSESVEQIKAGNILLQGISQDISADGMCLLTNQQMQERKKDKRYTLDFSFGKYRFILPARLVRMGDSSQFIQFKYEYGFIFEYAENSEERSRLITSMLQYRLQNAF
jgi:hypothetical protein